MLSELKAMPPNTTKYKQFYTAEAGDLDKDNPPCTKMILSDQPVSILKYFAPITQLEQYSIQINHLHLLHHHYSLCQREQKLYGICPL